MKTPICDFLTQYQQSGTVRFHMPGHKGRPFLGCEPWDLTEVQGADALYEAGGIIAESEQNATALFGTGRTLFSTEGSSQCIRAMLYLAINDRPRGTVPLILAARNVHKAFVYGAALLDFEVRWLWPEDAHTSLCGCPITARTLDKTLTGMAELPAAVYVTSPDYLGGVADIASLAEVCHRHGTRLLVDNAHGAYLRFLQPSRHPMDLGADLCCDSAHKTLPALTGSAYLHLSRRTPQALRDHAKQALALFGSTSPSYLTLASLDRCNAYLADGYGEKLALLCEKAEEIRLQLRNNGWQLPGTDPLRFTILASAEQDGLQLADRLREAKIECEYADPECLVLMFSPENRDEDFVRLLEALGPCPGGKVLPSLPLAKGVQRCNIRQALFAAHEEIPAEQALGRICGAPTVACPPAIPIAVSGEEIGEAALQLFRHYGVETVDVLT